VGPERQPHCPDGAQTALIAFGHRRFPPTVPTAMLPSSTASCGFKRSAPSKELLLSYFFFRSRPPLLLLMPCRRRLPHPTSFARRCLEPSPQPLFPDHRTPPTIKLHWLPSRFVDATPTTARASATFPNRELLTTTTGRHPSLSFPSGRALLSNVPPVISPPRRVTLAPLPNPPCHRLS
jgi:hypothetical protein